MGSYASVLSPIEGFVPMDGRIYTENQPRFAAYMKNVHDWTGALLEEAKMERSKDMEYNQMGRYMQYLVGDQWPKGRPSYRSRATVNRMWKLTWELLSLLTDVRPTFQVGSNREEYDSQAKMCDKAIRGWWGESNADLTLAQWIMYGMFGTSYGRFTWEPRLRNGEGDFQLLPLGMDSVMVLKANQSINDAPAVIYERPQPLGWFRQNFPTRYYAVQPDPSLSSYTVDTSHSGLATPMQFDLLSAGMKRVLGKKDSPTVKSAYPMAMYREFWLEDWSYNESNVKVLMGNAQRNWSYWVPPGARLYPRGRLIIKGGDIVLHDGPNPYWHGRCPIVPMRLNPVPWQWGGLSVFRPMVPLQDVTNQIIAGVIEMIQKTLNPQFYAPKNALSESVWQSFDASMPGGRLAWNMNAGQRPEFGQAPNVPAYVLQLLSIIFKEMDQESGVASVSEAMSKNQIPGADTLEQIKQSKQTTIRLKGRSIESSLSDVGQLAVPSIMQFYSLKRRLWMFGAKGVVPQDFDFDAKTMIPDQENPWTHVRSFPFILQHGTLLKLDHVQKAVAAMNLAGMGKIDDKTLLETIDLGFDVDEVLARNAAQQEKMAQLGMLSQAQGGGGGRKPH